MNKELWLQAAQVEGIEEFEIYEQKMKNTSIRLFEGSVDGFTISECKGIALRGIYHGKMGICFLEEDDDSLMEYALHQIIQNAEAITSNDEVEMYAGAQEYPVLEEKENHMIDLAAEEKIVMLKEIEEELLASDQRISQVMATNYGQVEVSRAIDNTKGIHLSDEHNASFISCSVMAKDGDDTRIANDWMYLHEKEELDPKAFALALSKKVISKLHGEPVESGSYPVMIQNEAMGNLLTALSGMFDGESIYKGISILKDQLGKQVFDERIRIVDDPLMKDGYESAAFDDEGVACYRKYLVEQGIFKTCLHNLKSAKLMKTTSTGNGFKGGYAASVGISPTNLYIEKGDAGYEEMIASMDKGIIITEITGLHAGLNPISTEFSLQSSGFLVEEGKIVRPVNLITIAGNFMDIMKNIRMIGEDLKMGSTGVGAPSILFESLAVSGK